MMLASAAWAAGNSTKLLAEHSTIARFEGTETQPCRFRTALCPDRCGHAQTTAKFTVVKYLNYKSHDQYGDPQTSRFYYAITGGVGKAPLASAPAAAIGTLKPGDLVRLDWNHEYVTQDGCSFPERPIVRLEKLTPEEAKKYAADVPAPQPAAGAKAVPAARATPMAR